MKLQIAGQFVKSTKETGTSAKGAWEKRNVWILAEGKDIVIEFFGDKYAFVDNLHNGANVNINAYLESREYNGKGYTKLSGVFLQSEQPSNGSKEQQQKPEYKIETPPVPEHIANQQEDDLPF